MHLFADESTPRVIVQWLRDAGHDVTWATELQPGETDEAWLNLAEAEGRLIVTADKDFGDLVFRDGRNTHGVLLLRLHGLAFDERIARIAAAWAVVEANPTGSFIVVSEHKVRVRRTKRPDGGK